MIMHNRHTAHSFKQIVAPRGAQTIIERLSLQQYKRNIRSRTGSYWIRMQEFSAALIRPHEENGKSWLTMR